MWSVIGILFATWIGLLGFQLWMQHSPLRKKKRALIDAIGRGNLEGVKQAVSSGLSLNFNYWSHQAWISIGSPLSLAMLKKDPAIAEFLISNGASPSPQSPGNEALLTNAVRGGNFELVEKALSAGHDIHFKPDKYSKPLASAIHHQDIQMARFLISKGASKEDLIAGGCRWHAMNTESILFVHGLGMEVPQQVLEAVQNGEWDRRAPAKSN